MDFSLHVFDTIQTTQIEARVSKIIRKIKQTVVFRASNAGHRLQAERFGVGRNCIPEATMKLDFYVY